MTSAKFNVANLYPSVVVTVENPNIVVVGEENGLPVLEIDCSKSKIKSIDVKGVIK